VISKVLIRTAVWLAVASAVLFVPAGTIYWPEAWVFLAGLGVLGLVSGLSLARHDPDLLKERMRLPLQREQKSWDQSLMLLIVLLGFAEFVVSALDAVRFQVSLVPLWIEILGATGVALGFYLYFVALRENTYAAPVVKIQKDREHRVITTGPYALVRHPLYAGAILFFFAAPLLLGSWYGLAFALVITALYVIRTVWEEATLKAELEGYDAYAARVRYRLVPGVW